MSLLAFSTGRGAGRRQSHVPPVPPVDFPTQAAHFVDPHFPFQPLPPPSGPAPFRYPLSRLLSADDIKRITDQKLMVFHTVGDTGDFRGRQQDFVAAMMQQDADALPDTQKPAFFYHLGDVVYFAGDLDKYGDNFYETYKEYPGFIVSEIMIVSRMIRRAGRSIRAKSRSTAGCRISCPRIRPGSVR